MTMKYIYSCKEFSDFEKSYYDAAAKKGSEVYMYDFENTCCGYGTRIYMAEGLKTFITREVYLNEWSSGQTLRGYNRTPEKFLRAIDCWENEEYEKGLKILN